MGRGRSTGGTSTSGGTGAKAPKWASKDKKPFREMSGADESAYMQKQAITPVLQAALDKYTDPNEQPGSLYNFSQNMNQALINGNMTREQQAVFNEINGAMHNIGYNAQLTRYDHYDTVNAILSQVGMRGDARNMSISQLKNALVGTSYTDSRILSTSVNGFKNSSDPSVFNTRQFKFTYLAKPTTQAMMPGIGKKGHRRSGMSHGDNFGEMLLGAGSTFKIVNVKYSGSRARSKGGSKNFLNLRQIEIVVEVG